MLVGHIFYIAAGSAGLALLVVSRLLVGFGTGTLTLARTFVGDHVPVARKSRFMAWLGIEQFVGFAFTPSFGALSFDDHIGAMHITTFNFGSYLLGTLTIFAFGGLFMVKRHWTKQEEQREQSTAGLQDRTMGPESNHAGIVTRTAQPIAVLSSSCSSSPALPASPPSSSFRQDALLWLLVFGNFSIRGSLSLAETFGSLIYFIVVTPGDSDQVSDSAIFFLLLGVGGVVVFLSVEYQVRLLGTRTVLCAALAIACVGYALMMDWDGDLPQTQFVAGQ